MNRPVFGGHRAAHKFGRQLETFFRGWQAVVLLIIFGMTILYFNSINQPVTTYNRLSKPIADHRPLTTANLSGPQLLTLSRPVNINTAEKADLAAIRGIGLLMAERIVEFRVKHGRFERIEDITKVSGIKKKKFENIKRYLTVK